MHLKKILLDKKKEECKDYEDLFFFFSFTGGIGG